MKKSLLAAAGLVGAAAVVLAGCTASGGGDEGPVTITYTNFISNGGNEDNLQKIVDAFEKDNPNITVDVTTLPYADYGTALQTDLAAGTESDVFDIEYAKRTQVRKGSPSNCGNCCPPWDWAWSLGARIADYEREHNNSVTNAAGVVLSAAEVTTTFTGAGPRAAANRFVIPKLLVAHEKVVHRPLTCGHDAQCPEDDIHDALRSFHISSGDRRAQLRIRVAWSAGLIGGPYSTGLGFRSTLRPKRR